METYRANMKTKNDQIASLKTTRDEKIALLAAQDAKLSSSEERAIALQSKLDATFRGLKEKVLFFSLRCSILIAVVHIGTVVTG